MNLTRYHGRNYSIHDPPTYREIPKYNTIIIGAPHSHSPEGEHDLEERIRKFLLEMRENGHLILEGTSRFNEPKIKPDEIDYEALALAYFKGSKHFLEDGANFQEIAERYGMKGNLLGLYNAFRSLSRVLAVTKGDTQEAVEKIGQVLRNFKNYYPGLDKIDVDDTITKLRFFISKYPDLIDISQQFGDFVFPFYSAELREHEILCPKAQELATTLDGRKRLIVGIAHVNGIERYLRGESLEAPKEWRVLVEQLDPQLREFVRLIEDKLL